MSVFAVVFAMGGVYLLSVINHATERLDELIVLHQVEILREHYLLQLRRVQSDLTLVGTQHARSFDTMVANAVNMRVFIETCFDCHHAQPVEERIRELRWQTQLYQDSLSRVLTIRANRERLAREQDAAFHVGEQLIDQVGEMIALTGSRLEAATQQSLKEIDDTKYALYLLVGIAPLLSAALGYFFISGLTNPVKVLLRSTRRLQAGDLDHRVAKLRDEFGELADAFNEMSASLKEQMQKMQRTEQLAVVGELAAGLAHEIKNPLAGIKVAMHVLAEESYLSDEDREVVHKVGHEVTRLELLMKSFLDFARPAKPRLESVDINELVSNSMTFYTASRKRPTRKTMNVEIIKELGRLPRTAADPMQLQQVFLNLVLNAVDAMPDGGRLTVRTAFERSDNAIVVEVTDTGRGIDPERIDRIFEPFFTTKPKGTGLGLSICRQLIEQHRGRISVTSRPGQGTRFRIALPVRSVEEGAAA